MKANGQGGRGALLDHKSHGLKAAAAGRLCRALLAATQEHSWLRVGTCAGDDCVDVYVDQDGRGARRYCSATCLNRARVRAYRSRQGTGPR